MKESRKTPWAEQPRDLSWKSPRVLGYPTVWVFIERADCVRGDQNTYKHRQLSSRRHATIRGRSAVVATSEVILLTLDPC